MDQTKSQALFEDIVTQYYVPFEVWYTSTVIDKVRPLYLFLFV